MGAVDSGPGVALMALVEKALSQGIAQVHAVGSPLHPFFLDEAGTMYLLYDGGSGADPMEMALKAIKENAPQIQRCALIIDTRLTLADGKKWDAIVAMACERDAETGTVWGQRYVPKGLFRKFRVEGEREEVATCKNFIAAALEAA